MWVSGSMIVPEVVVNLGLSIGAVVSDRALSSASVYHVGRVRLSSSWQIVGTSTPFCGISTLVRIPLRRRITAALQQA